MATGKYKEWLEEDNLTKLRAWARDGLNDEQIAKNMDIHVSTLYDWKNKYSEINEALKKGKEIVDIEVENSVHKSALGFKVVLNKQKVTKDGDVIDYQDEVYFPPNITAAMYWLNNRKPESWKNKREIDASEESLSKLDEIIKGFKDAAKQ